ncbi:IS66 family insertion sequence element accessory protein TnpB [Bradyrhizobium arachidis]|uniref:IS66 family insertion sequence element accessory protein TnpB n=1 Tax=Bradyrhizobium arachidis TaxID=858423 RepID=UPI003221C727
MLRGRAGTLIKALWHDGVGLSLYAKRLDGGGFIWPATVDGGITDRSSDGLFAGGDRLAQRATQLYASGQHPGQARRSAAAPQAAAALDCWVAFQFHGSRSATLLTG